MIEVLAQVRHSGRQPGVRHVVAAQSFVEAGPSQLRPFRAQRRQMHASRRQQRIDERKLIVEIERCFHGRIVRILCIDHAVAELRSARSFPVRAMISSTVSFRLTRRMRSQRCKVGASACLYATQRSPA